MAEFWNPAGSSAVTAVAERAARVISSGRPCTAYPESGITRVAVFPEHGLMPLPSQAAGLFWREERGGGAGMGTGDLVIAFSVQVTAAGA